MTSDTQPSPEAIGATLTEVARIIAGGDVRVVHLDRGEAWTLVNPRITSHSDESWVLWDPCL